MQGQNLVRPDFVRGEKKKESGLTFKESTEDQNNPEDLSMNCEK